MSATATQEVTEPRSEEATEGLRTPGVFIEYHEQCVCMQCSGVIPAENVQRRLIPSTAISPTRNELRCKCDHCNKHYRLLRELRGGVWSVVQAEVVANQREIDSLNRRLDFLHGNRSVKATG
jgi:hypothetical protein